MSANPPLQVDFAPGENFQKVTMKTEPYKTDLGGSDYSKKAKMTAPPKNAPNDVMTNCNDEVARGAFIVEEKTKVMTSAEPLKQMTQVERF